MIFCYSRVKSFEKKVYFIRYTYQIFGYILQHINDFLCSKTVLPSNHYIRLHFANTLSQFWLTNLLVKGVFLHTVLYGRISMYFSAENGVLMRAFPMIYHILPLRKLRT